METYGLLWFDCETTGLYERGGHSTHKILEVAAFTSDMYLEKVSDHVEFVVKNDLSECKSLANDYVLDMHESTGLWDEIELDSALDLKEVEAQLIQMVKNSGYDRVVLAGSSIHFDRFFIASQMPDLNDALFYKNFDVSSCIAMYQMSTGNDPTQPVMVGNEHRAYSDARRSYDLAVNMVLDLENRGLGYIFTGLKNFFKMG